jgi:hypothetical protein
LAWLALAFVAPRRATGALAGLRAALAPVFGAAFLLALGEVGAVGIFELLSCFSPPDCGATVSLAWCVRIVLAVFSEANTCL